MIRPGPDRIEPGTCPSGVVVRIYSVPHEVLVIEQRLTGADDIEQVATLAAQLDLPGWAACLVAYDGDTGQRYTETDWTGG